MNSEKEIKGRPPFDSNEPSHSHSHRKQVKTNGKPAPIVEWRERRDSKPATDALDRGGDERRLIIRKLVGTFDSTDQPIVMKIISLFAITLILKVNILAENSVPTETAIQWVTGSSEYKAVCLQTYVAAWEKVETAATNSIGAWAIVMDIDETVLSNGQYQLELNSKKASHSQEAWEIWVNRTEAKPVPGAKEFILKMRGLPNGRIIFLSNRFARNAKATRRNLQKHGLIEKDDVLLLRKNRGDTKEKRQQEVFMGTGRMASHGKVRVLAWYGDAAHDFPHDPKLKWGKQKFMLPNPVYGSW